MLWWVGSVVGLLALAVIGIGGIADVTAENALLLCGAFVLLFITALIAVASSGSSQQ